MTMMTALEIFGNPNDLDFMVWEDQPGKSYNLAITRGPGHRGKLLISSNTPMARQQALDLIKSILDTSFSVGMVEIPKFDGDALKCLTKDNITRIMADLEATGECHTHLEPATKPA